jgi:hypothetical protein
MVVTSGGVLAANFAVDVQGGIPRSGQTEASDA